MDWDTWDSGKLEGHNTMTIIPRTLHYYLAITLDPYSIFHSTFYPRTILNLKKSRLLPLYTIPRRHKDVRIFAYIEGGEFENQPLPFIYYKGEEKPQVH
jgi:hypothetical protein